jgi:hypothetical protein
MGKGGRAAGGGGDDTAVKAGRDDNSGTPERRNVDVDRHDSSKIGKDDNGGAIDLMRALRIVGSDPSSSSSANQKSSSATSLSDAKKAESDFARSFFAGIPNLDQQLSTARRRTLAEPSPFGRVMCRRWHARERLLPPLTEGTPVVAPFAFDTPSPDDVVKKAQYQVFGRRV